MVLAMTVGVIETSAETAMISCQHSETPTILRPAPDLGEWAEAEIGACRARLAAGKMV